jgi:hypothetical protein
MFIKNYRRQKMEKISVNLSMLVETTKQMGGTEGNEKSQSTFTILKQIIEQGAML